MQATKIQNEIYKIFIITFNKFKNIFRRVSNKLPMVYVGLIIDTHNNLIHQGNYSWFFGHCVSSSGGMPANLEYKLFGILLAYLQNRQAIE
jgi:hypothetical protein